MLILGRCNKYLLIFIIDFRTQARWEWPWQYGWYLVFSQWWGPTVTRSSDVWSRKLAEIMPMLCRHLEVSWWVTLDNWVTSCTHQHWIDNLLTWLMFHVQAFMRLYVESMIIRPCTVAIVALSFAVYSVKYIFPECDPPDEAVRLLAAICIGKTITIISLCIITEN